jgi:hypothetical protein
MVETAETPKENPSNKIDFDKVEHAIDGLYKNISDALSQWTTEWESKHPGKKYSNEFGDMIDKGGKEAMTKAFDKNFRENFPDMNQFYSLVRQAEQRLIDFHARTKGKYLGAETGADGLYPVSFMKRAGRDYPIFAESKISIDYTKFKNKDIPDKPLTALDAVDYLNGLISFFNGNIAVESQEKAETAKQARAKAEEFKNLEQAQADAILKRLAE